MTGRVGPGQASGMIGFEGKRQAGSLIGFEAGNFPRHSGVYT